jgi:hypothetical protein
MTPVELIRARLKQTRCQPRGQRKLTARCPAHDDRNPSLCVSEGDDGRALVHCFAGCTTEAIVAALDLRMRDLFPNRTAWRSRRCTEAKPDYLIVTVLGQHVAAPAKSCDGADVPALAPVDHAVLRILHDHAYFAPTCCPSQELIGEEAGDLVGEPLSQPTVNRSCMRLRALGLITWTHVLAPGARFYHNVYTLLTHWHRPYRNAVMARIRAARARLGRRSSPPVNTKRTARDVENHAGRARTRRRDAQSALTTAQKANSPPSDGEWQLIWDQLAGRPASRCAILGAD